MPIELPGFEEATRRHKWKGSRAIQRYRGVRHCTRCEYGDVIRLTTGIQPALFYFGGYGASERKTVDVCTACGRVLIVGLETLNPRHAY